MDFLREFHGPNAAYILELYDRYSRNPDSVDESTRARFAHWKPPAEDDFSAVPIPGTAWPVEQLVAVTNLAQAIRGFGHLAATLDPLGMANSDDPSLELETYGLTETLLREL